MMLRGHLASGELLRVLLKPCLKRNFASAPLRYANEKDGRKVEGMLSWLKDIIKNDGNSDEARAVIIRETRNSQTSLIKYKPKDVIENNASRETMLIIDKRATRFGGKPRSLISKRIASLNRVKSKDKSTRSTAWLVSTYPSPLDSHLLTPLETTKVQVRTIVSCTPRNTKPPIREPNVPERRKDDKKDKKKKKPVIRMEHVASEDFSNVPSMEDKSELHDNVDVNFRYQWGIRLSEDGDKEVPNTGSGTNYSAYDAQMIEAIKDFQLNMSSAKDSNRKQGSSKDVPAEALMKAAAANAAAKQSKDEAAAESRRNLLKNAPAESKENTAGDDDYNIPSNTNFDAELSAWKDMVLKSKLPAEAAKEEFLDTDGGTNTKMLSIRPEPPRPRLDVRAVPVTVDESDKDDEDDVDMAKEFKGSGKSGDPKRSGPSGVQKLDSKKLHTGMLAFLRSAKDDRVDGFDEKSLVREPSKPQDADIPTFIDGTPEYPNKVEGNWSRIGQSNPKGGGDYMQLQNRSPEKSNLDRAEDAAASETMNAVRQMQQHEPEYRHQDDSDMDSDYVERLETVAEKDIEMALGHGHGHHQDDHEVRESGRNISDHRDSRRYESDDHMRSMPEDRGNLEYSQYEDDFYPGYDSMSLEPIAEKPSEKTRQEKTSKHEPQQKSASENRETFAKGEEPGNKAFEDGNYIKVPGDPYPYSKEHFNKWILPNRDIQIGGGSGYEKGNIINDNVSPEIQPPVRKMSTWRSS